ncbi:hypothetical protein [Nonomuraea sp. NPDC049400]|uniref:hypothetical protein n=1 Tax=Nonomuraea sp. NPDC049400 TaxID=3364352 RepID=UPI0037AC6E5C
MRSEQAAREEIMNRCEKVILADSYDIGVIFRDGALLSVLAGLACHVDRLGGVA